jgi:hypothetical protein
MPMISTAARFRFVVGLVALLAAPEAEGQSIDFKEFTAEQGLTLNGAARVASAGEKKVLRVTPAEELQAGSAFFTEKVALKDGFETTFTFQITGAVDVGADGFAFVIQNSGAKALGSTGSGLGYGAADAGEEAIAKSLAIEFDTFSLKEAGADDGMDFGDPNGNHISVHSRGPEPNNVDESYSLGTVTEGLPSFKDGKPHTVKVSYTPGSLKIYVDNMEKPVQTLAIKLDAFSGKGFQNASVLDADGKAWVGFTAGTGGLWENHDIQSWTLTPGAPRP